MMIEEIFGNFGYSTTRGQRLTTMDDKPPTGIWELKNNDEGVLKYLDRERR